MSGRYSDMVAFAYDADNNRYPITSQYSYSAGCGCYHYMVQVKDRFFDIEAYVEDEQPKTTGTYLPYIYQKDFESYFSDSPTEAMKTILHEAELDGINIDHFLLIDVKSVNAGPYSATCCRISREEIISREYDLCEGELAYEVEGDNKVDAVIEALINKAEKQEEYWKGEQPKFHKYAESVTYGLSSDNHIYVVFRESSHIDDSENHSYRAMLGNKCFLLGDYNELSKDDERPFPCAYVSDYESYFSTAPTNTIEALLDKAKLADKRFTCFVIVDMNTNSDGEIEAVCNVITPEKTEVHEYSVKDFDKGLLCAIEAM